MCASTHWLASATAQSVLERGGNAFDAATEGAFVLADGTGEPTVERTGETRGETCDPDSSVVQAAANPRGAQGYAVGR